MADRHRYEIRVSEREREDWPKWAELCGFRTVSEWLRHLANSKGMQVESTLARAGKKSTG